MKHSFKLKETFHYPFFVESFPNELTLRKRVSAKMTNFTNSISKGCICVKVLINLSKKSVETIQLSLTSFSYNKFFCSGPFSRSILLYS